MNAPACPSGTAGPLHLYDYTHGMRRLSLWRSVCPITGKALLHVAAFAPLTLQAPGKAPTVEWEQVVHCAAVEAALALLPMQHKNGSRWSQRWQLGIGFTTFQLLAIEVDAIADYLGLAIDTSEDDA